MESKKYDEDKLDNNNTGNDQSESLLNTIKIESILDKSTGIKEEDSKNINKDEYSSLEEDCYSDKSSDYNSDCDKESKRQNLSKSLTIKERKIYSQNEKYDMEKRRSNLIENKLITSIIKKENANRKNLKLAGSINFKTIPDQIIETDEFGFLKNIDITEETPKSKNIDNIEKEKDDKNNINPKLSKEYLLLVNSRTEKWIYMIEHYDVFSTKKFGKLKQRTRKGIPDNLRSNVWQLFGEMKKFYKKDIFQQYLEKKLDEDIEETIIKDLDRTFPLCLLFKDKYGDGQRKLYRVLSSYSLYNQEVGYVQGMSFIVALFLIYMNEESSFFMLDSIMNKYEMKGIYLPNFPDLKKKFYVLLNLEKKFLPKIYEVLKRDNILPSLYASEWFICLFSKDLNINVVVRIFDVFLLEGYKIIYRFALAFLKLKEKYFLSSKGMMDSMNVLHIPLDNIDIEYLFNIAFGFHLSKNMIKKYETEYEKNKNNEKDEFIIQL